ncbi:RDD family protein [Aliikangiella sp. IMCC44653]
MLDTTKQVEVPEGITLSLPVAGAVCRSLAFLLDLVIRWSLLFVIILVFSFFGKFGDGVLLLTFFLVEWFYPVIFEVFNHGQTIGKKVLKIVVVNDDGTPIDWSSSMVRNLLRFVDFLPFMYALGILSMLFSKDFKRLGDFAAGTLVIHRLEHSNLVQQNQLSARAPKIALTLEEQSALMAFAERSNQISSPRQNELASILSAWLDRALIKSGKTSAASQLMQIAKWLRGSG